MEAESSIDKDRKFMMEQVRMRMKMLQVIHLALVSGVLIFGVCVLFIVRKRFSFEISFRDPMIIIAVVLSVGTILTSCLLKKTGSTAPQTHHDVHDILNKYQVYFLVRASIIEAGALFAGVATLVTCNVVPVVVFASSAMVLALRRPSERELISLASLNKGPYSVQ
ncbi:MAG: hypothetical protein A2283_15725 [Lentisphaerae bacterium RIFOXYA12_FULL_48_11]|nr:MAG: hypothetical protein A2283_15725 [Lentisphaerae bacterium RIFOXYA12_FULL_48_11]